MNFQLYSRVTLILFFLIACEPDDICLESNTDTPNLIIKFVDSFSGETKSNEIVAIMLLQFLIF